MRLIPQVLTATCSDTLIAAPILRAPTSSADDESLRYYDGFMWAFSSTVAPMMYSHTELVYNVLEQGSIARGQATYYLKWTDEALAEAGDAYHTAGVLPVGQLPAAAAQLRQAAIDATKKVETAFTKKKFFLATYAAQEAWRNAEANHDCALGLAPGTSELEKGTQLNGASSCALATKVTTTHNHSTHDHNVRQRPGAAFWRSRL